MPPAKLLEQSKRAKYFINSKACSLLSRSVTTQADGGLCLWEVSSRRGKKRVPRQQRLGDSTERL